MTPCEVENDPLLGRELSGIEVLMSGIDVCISGVDVWYR